MIISRVRLKNFKSYTEQIFEGLDTNLSKKRNIILIGGLNGAGKTSFLEAIVLCLYGDGSTNFYPTKGTKNENYYAYICSLFHRRSILKPLLKEKVEMSVQIDLSEVNISHNVSRMLSIKRTWTLINVDKNISFKKEKLEILENDSLIENLANEKEYQDYINKLIPYSVSQFFFFDGEKIQDFAKDTDTEFSQSLQSIVGIELYKTLYDDLKKVRERITTKYNKDAEAQKKLLEKQTKIAELEQIIANDQIEFDNLEDDINELKIEQEKQKNEVKRLTKIDARTKVEFDNKKDRLEKEKEELKGKYFEASKLYLPFIFTYKLCKEIDEQIKNEHDFKKWEATQAAFQPKLEQFTEQIFNEKPPSPKPSLTLEQKKYYTKKIEKTLKDFLSKAKPKHIDAKIIHDFSTNEEQKIYEVIHELNGGFITKLQSYGNRLKEIESILSTIDRTERRAGNGDEQIKKLYENLTQTTEKIGSKQEKQKTILYQTTDNERLIKVVKREITEWEKKVVLQKQHKKQIDYCLKLRKTVSEFTKRFQAQKTQALEKAILEIWKKLARKKEVISSIKIDAESNFKIELIDKHGDVVDKTKISAGEKEIYAICLLWALTKVSGRQIPIVIDTPYG